MKPDPFPVCVSRVLAVLPDGLEAVKQNGDLGDDITHPEADVPVTERVRRLARRF